MQARQKIITAGMLVVGGLACAGAPIETSAIPQDSSNVPTADDDRAILDAWMAASRGQASGNKPAAAESLRPKSGESDPIKLVQWAVVHPDRQAGWRGCLDLKSRQDRGTLDAFSPWPFICRAMLLAEQRMFDQSDRMLAASNIKLASIDVAYAIGHLQKKRFDKVRSHLVRARETLPSHPLLDFIASQVATDKVDELRFLEAVYSQEKNHFSVLTRLAKFYDEKGDPRATDLLLAAANVSPENTEMRLLLAERFRKENKLKLAKEQYLAIIEAVPFNVGALNFLAADAAQNKDYKTQLKYVQALISEVKDTKARRSLEAELLAKSNQKDAAEKAYKKLLENDHKNVAGNLYLAKRLLGRGKPFKAIAHFLKAGEAGRAELATMADSYELKGKLTSKGKTLNPTIWKIEALLKKRFRAALKRGALIKGGRVTWTMYFDDKGQCVKVSHKSNRVKDPWFLVGGYLLHLTIAHKSAAGGEISWDLSVP
jgi:lipopolysaccharide biosynthesis regulator YciM